MVAEMRAARTELDNQRHFTKEGDKIETVRDYLRQWMVGRDVIDPAIASLKSASSMRRAANSGLFEVG